MSDKIVYFIYSSEQANIKKEAHKRLGHSYRPPTVMVNGKMKQYTEIVTDTNNISYSDGIVVASGYKSRMKYTK